MLGFESSLLDSRVNRDSDFRFSGRSRFCPASASFELLADGIKERAALAEIPQRVVQIYSDGAEVMNEEIGNTVR